MFVVSFLKVERGEERYEENFMNVCLHNCCSKQPPMLDYNWFSVKLTQPVVAAFTMLCDVCHSSFSCKYPD